MAAIDTDTTVVAGTDHVSTTVDGETVLLNTNRGTYQGLSGVGPRVWELIQEPTAVEAVVDTIAAEYDVERERCARDVRSFLGDLVDERLAEIDGAATE